MPALQGAIGDRNVTAGGEAVRALMFRTRLDRDAVIANADVTVRDTHEATRIGVDPIGVGRIGRVDDRHAAHIHVLTMNGIDRPAR